MRYGKQLAKKNPGSGLTSAAADYPSSDADKLEGGQ